MLTPHPPARTDPVDRPTSDPPVTVSTGPDRAMSPPCVHQLLAAQARRSGSRRALVGRGQSWTYEQLDQEANRRARRLRLAGVGPEVVVGCLIADPAQMVLHILAVLKAGGAYLLLDARLPPERLKFMVTDAGPALIIHDQPLPEPVAAVMRGALSTTQLGEEAASLSGADLDGLVGPQNAAYLAYTSGTTGRPKGVVITHGGLVVHCQEFVRLFRPGPGDRVPMMAPAAFDVATEEILPALLGGACLVAAPATHEDMAQFTDEVRRGRFTILNLPASLWRMWTHYLRDQRVEIPLAVRLVIAGSEEIPAATLRDWFELPRAHDLRWVAAYGTTETTVTSSVYLDAAADFGVEPVTEVVGGLVPIGRPIGGTHFHLLDAGGWPVRDGDVGELHIGGAGLAREYVDRGEETRRKFVPDRICGSAGERLYRTGDLARRRADGNYVWVGRRDAQLKVHGLRIEPAEIEAVLAEHPDVSRAAVVLRRDPAGRGRDELCAFVVARRPGQLIDAARLRDHLARRVPATMIPGQIVAVRQLPFGLNGKLDRARLADLVADKIARVR